MNGQYHLINQKGNKFKFYWAPMSPDIKWGKYDNWGVAVVDWIGRHLIHDLSI